MVFLRAVEVFPPLFPISPIGGKPLDPAKKLKRFVEGVKGIAKYSDLVLVASVKNPAMVRFSPIEAAVLLEERLRVKASPTIVVRDENRLQLLSSVMTAITLGLRTLTLVWGDRYPARVRATNVRDYPSLSSFIEEAKRIGRLAGVKTMILAPIDLSRLDTESGVAVARSRLKSGADLLLAQPPTTDSGETLEAHSAVLKSSGLKDRVLLNVFPFRSRRDVAYCEKYFGWKLPPSLHRLAESGRPALLREARSVAEQIRDQGHTGAYITTRGHPEVARSILG